MSQNNNIHQMSEHIKINNNNNNIKNNNSIINNNNNNNNNYNIMQLQLSGLELLGTLFQEISSSYTLLCGSVSSIRLTPNSGLV